MRLEAHRGEIAERPGGGRGEAGHGAGIHQPGGTTSYIFYLSHARNVGMAAADEVPVPRARHRIAVLGIVHDEDLPPAELEARVGAVVLQLPIAVARPARERDRVAQ